VETSDDPRWLRSREAILQAARALLVRDGPPGVTHQRVAQEAGVGRATVYRHWPKPEQLLLDAMSGVELPFFLEPVAPVRPWLHQQLRKAAGELAMPAVVAVAATLQHHQGEDPRIAARRDRLVGTVTDRLHTALTLAVAEGELDAMPDPRDAVALLIGPITYRTGMQASDVTDDLIDQVIDSVGTWRPGRA
jgi:AcrR family transcriptional regulator